MPMVMFEAQSLPPALSIPVTPFIGRRAELEGLSALLQQADTRLITLLGPGGVGKTRLALAAADLHRLHLDQRVCFVSLQAVTAAEQIAATLAESIGFVLHGETSLEEQVFHYLRDKSLLLVLDNLEHLPQSADFIAQLLRVAPGVQVIATSREKLNLLAEIVFPVEGFQTGEWMSTDQARDADVVQLFEQCAQRAQPSFTLNDSSLNGIMRICRLTGGMPLALELAAAWVAVLSVDDIATEIERSYRFLESQFRDMPPRHRSLRATFESSWQRLFTHEQEILMRLSVFSGPFSRTAAQAVAGATIADLQSFVSKSLLKSHPARGYEIHDLLRQYLTDHLDQTGNGDNVRAVWCRHYLERLENWSSAIKSSTQRETLDDVQREFDNIRAAWLYACVHYQTLLEGAVEGLFLFFLIRSRYQDGDYLFDQAEGALPNHQDVAAERTHARIVLYRIWLHRWRQGTFARHPVLLIEIKSLESSIARAGTARDQAIFRLLLGVASHEVNAETDQAAALLADSLSRFEAQQDDYYSAWALHFQAGYARDTAGLSSAIELQMRTLERRRVIADLSGQVYALYNLGLYWLQMGNLDQSQAYAQEMRERSLSLGERSGELMSGSLIGMIAVLRGDFPHAEEWADRAIQMAADLNHVLSMGYARAVRGITAILRGDTTSGSQSLHEMAQESLPGSLSCFVQLGLCMAHIEDQPERHLQAAARYALAIQGDGLIRWCLALQAVSTAQHGALAQAAACLSSADPVFPVLEDWKPLVRLRHRFESNLALDFSVTMASAPADVLRKFAFNTEVSSMPARVLAANQALAEPLSDRELEVLALIANGLSNRDIANHLVVGMSTVKKHISHIYDKLGVASREEARLQAQALGLSLTGF